MNQDNYEFLYPHHDDPMFNYKIAQRKEFQDTMYEGKILNVEEEANLLCSKSMELAPHQLFVRNFLSFNTPYNSLLLYHGLGSGKTCSAITVAEEMRDYMSQMGITKRIIVIASPVVQENFKLQLFDERQLKFTDGRWDYGGCTGNEFLKELFVSNRKEDKEKIIRQAKKIIQSNYLFMGYTEFNNFISKQIEVLGENLSTSQIQRIKKKKIEMLFNNRLIIIDEVHNIRTTLDGENKKVATNLLLVAKNSKYLRLLLLSATPMYNSYKEIIFLINLMNINDNRSEVNIKEIFDIDGNFLTDKEGNQIGKDLFIQKLTGYISYVRGENPYTFPYKIFPSIFSPQNSLEKYKYPRFALNDKVIENKIEYLSLFMLPLETYQNKIYNTIIDNIKKEEANKLKNSFENMDTFGYTLLMQPIQALNITYPVNDPDPKKVSESIGKLGLRNCMDFTEKMVNGLPEKSNFSYKKDKEPIFQIDNLQKYSSKMFSICKSIQNSEGIVLIYSQYIEGGLIPMALALEELGYKKYKTKSLLKNPPKTNLGNYILISGEKGLSPDNISDVKAASSGNNINGEKIKIILISKTGTEGLDFKNIRQIHIMEPWYNVNRIEQIEGRGVRFCSHKDLPFQRRNVSIFLYGSVLENREQEAADLYVYRIAELKAIQIGKVTRILKQTAVDCLLNIQQIEFTEKKMNQIVNLQLFNGEMVPYAVGDKPFSPICDYMENCSYTCIPNKQVKTIIQDSYDDSFIVLNNEKIKQRIRQLFKEYYVIDKKKLFTEIQINKSYPKEQIYSSINNLIEQPNEFLLDRYGRKGKLINLDDLYLFQPFEISNENISIFDRSVPIEFKHQKLTLPITEKVNIQLSDKIEDLLQKINVQFNIGINSNPDLQEKKITDWFLLFQKCMWLLKLQFQLKEEEIHTILLGHIIDHISTTQKLILINYLYSNPITIPNEKIIKSIIDKRIINHNGKQGIFLIENKKVSLYVKNELKWKKGKLSDIEEFSPIIKNYSENIIESLNNTIGFISIFKEDTIVFKTKNINIKRNKGARCDQAGKNDIKKTISDINPDVPMPYINFNTTELCAYMENILRYFELTKNNNKIWFLDASTASLINIENYSKN